MSANTSRQYQHQFELKYGCNPYQKPAHIFSVGDKGLPFKILNGKPGYINLLDAINAWQLVLELKTALGVPAAASFKHCSPAGAAIAVPLSDELRAAYEVKNDQTLTPSALAYLRARNADPKSSFGDFAALSDPVDEETALILKTRVSDGIIAPSYDDKALEILSAKKGGKFIVLQADADFVPPETEFREMFGVVFSQRRNDVAITHDLCFKPENIRTARSEIPDGSKRDLILAAIATKFTQSNSVGFAKDGQMIGVGAGQQSRVDCVKLAMSKARVWYLRQHPKVQGLKFREGLKRVERLNARIKYIEGDLTEPERKLWEANFAEVPEPLSDAEKRDFLASLDDVCLFSDAFFPFRDNIDQASKIGVKYVLQPGGSVQDEGVIGACNDYDMAMAFNGTRVFHH